MTKDTNKTLNNIYKKFLKELKQNKPMPTDWGGTTHYYYREFIYHGIKKFYDTYGCCLKNDTQETSGVFSSIKYKKKSYGYLIYIKFMRDCFNPCVCVRVYGGKELGILEKKLPKYYQDLLIRDKSLAIVVMKSTKPIKIFVEPNAIERATKFVGKDKKLKIIKNINME